MRAVGERHEIRHLPFKPRIDQLLLRMVDDVAVAVHDEAVAVPADTYLIDISRDSREPYVDRDLRGVAEGLVGSLRYRNDPRIIVLENGYYVRRGDVDDFARIRHREQRQIGIDHLLGRVVRPDARVVVMRIVSRDHDDIISDIDKILEQFLLRRRILDAVRVQLIHDLDHVGGVVVDGYRDLLDRLVSTRDRGFLE